VAASIHIIKKFSQPALWTINPVGAEAITLGKAIRLLKRAYCVAVNLLSVILAIKDGTARQVCQSCAAGNVVGVN